jgi:hypothetical protein
VGDVEIYRPESENVIDTVNDHLDIIEEEQEGDIDMAKIESEVEQKNRDQIIQMDGVTADLPKCNMQSVD